jgi:serine protein kinase
MTTTEPQVEDFLAEAEREAGQFQWEGTFADYFRNVTENPSLVRLAHKLVHDAIMSNGTKKSASTGKTVYRLFENKIFGQVEAVEQVVDFFMTSSSNPQKRKRILLLVGPTASGKSTVVDLLKTALQRFTRTDEGAVFAIHGCPLQEEPLHLIPNNMRPKLFEKHRIKVEGDLCPRCQRMLDTQYSGEISRVPVSRVVFSEQKATGIGYYDALKDTDPSILAGCADASPFSNGICQELVEGHGLDGAFHVANRGLLEFVRIFQADSQSLSTLLELVEDRRVRLDKSGAIYTDEVVVALSTGEEYKGFLADSSYEALRGRIVPVHLRYNLRTRDERRLYRSIVKGNGMDDVHVPPLCLPAISTLAVLSRLQDPQAHFTSLLEKLQAYDGVIGQAFTLDDLHREQQSCPGEGLTGLSPLTVMNRFTDRASRNDVTCITPMNALHGIWQDLKDNTGLSPEENGHYIQLFQLALAQYGERVIKEVQRAYVDSFDRAANDQLNNYLSDVAAALSMGSPKDVPREIEHNLADMEKNIGVGGKERDSFRREIRDFFSNLKQRNVSIKYSNHPRLKEAIEIRLFPHRKTLRRELTEPKSADKFTKWRRIRGSIHNRLVNDYKHCAICAGDIAEFALFLLNGSVAVKAVKGDLEWCWDLNPSNGTAAQYRSLGQ